MTVFAPQPVFVLTRPQMGENIGAAARAMWNFGLDRMRIVAPRDGWPNQKAVAMASGAGRLLDEAVIYDTEAEALSDCDYVYATTARPRDLSKRVLTPQAAMREAQDKITQGQKIAVMFGPERAGLENDVIAQANAIISVPVNPQFASLNLGQCVLLTSYEWQLAQSQGAVHSQDVVKSQPASQGDVEALAAHYEQRLDEAGFFYPPEKAAGMKVNLRNLWSRLPLERADVQMLHGMMRQMLRWREQGDRGNS